MSIQNSSIQALSGGSLDIRKSKNKLKKWFLFIMLLLICAPCVNFMVFEGIIYCKYQYSYSIVMPAYACIFYGVSFMIMNRRINPFRTQGNGHLNVFQFKIGGVSGLAMGTNSVLITLSNPHTPGFYQTIFAQLNVVFVAITTFIFLRRKYYKFQVFSIVIALIGGLIPVFEGVSESSYKDVMWYILFMVAILALGVSNIIAENAFQNLKDKKTGKYLLSTLQYYFASSCWSLVFILAYWMIPSMEYEDKFTQYAFNGLQCFMSLGFSEYCAEHHPNVLICCDTLNENGSCDTNKPALGMASVWLQIVLWPFCLVFAAGLTKLDGSMYVTLGLTLAPIIAGITFAIEPIVGVFYHPLKPLDILSFIITFIGVAMFKYSMTNSKFEPNDFRKYSDKYRTRFDLRYLTIDKRDFELNDEDIDQW